MPYKPQWFQSPINIPEGVSGNIRVSHRTIPVGQDVTIVGFRQALLRGTRPVTGTTKQPLKVHELSCEQRGVWMTDLPEELNQLGEMVYNVKPKGRVLVGGLGLGIMAGLLANNTADVDEVVVVEINPDVIKLCRGEGYTVINRDIMDFLRKSDQQFDYYLLDTWQGTNESTWWSEVMPQRRAIRQNWGKKPVIHCWAEDIMHGQIFRSLTTKPPHWYYSGLPMPMNDATARRFLRDVGLPAWEKKYGRIIDDNSRRER